MEIKLKLLLSALDIWMNPPPAGCCKSRYCTEQKEALEIAVREAYYEFKEVEEECHI